MNSERIDSLVERLGNLLRAEERASGSVDGLQPIHMQIMRYLSACNRYSNTPAAVTEFVGATKGTTSQSINVLEKKGFLEKRPDDTDGRVIHLVLTAKAERFLESEFPPPGFTEALSVMKPVEREKLFGLLNQFLVLLQKNNKGRAFGVCETCRYFKRNAFGDSHQCGLTLEHLSDNDSSRICREHEYPSKKAV